MTLELNKIIANMDDAELVELLNRVADEIELRMMQKAD